MPTPQTFARWSVALWIRSNTARASDNPKRKLRRLRALDFTERRTSPGQVSECRKENENELTLQITLSRRLVMARFWLRSDSDLGYDLFSPNSGTARQRKNRIQRRHLRQYCR